MHLYKKTLNCPSTYLSMKQKRSTSLILNLAVRLKLNPRLRLKFSFISLIFSSYFLCFFPFLGGGGGGGGGKSSKIVSPKEGENTKNFLMKRGSSYTKGANHQIPPAPPPLHYLFHILEELKGS